MKDHLSPCVVGLIATRNRESLSRALKSIQNQTRPIDHLVVVSDSDDNRVFSERSLIELCGGVYLRERHNHAHNYAGSLNVGVDYIVTQFLIKDKLSADNIYIAILDDDDKWHYDYLELCCQGLAGNTDFVVAGIIRNGEPLSIPQTLSIHSFLRGNPHIQGSNTFVRLSTLLKAGSFDESMPSTTDRDLFTRIMQMNPDYSIINQHLVDIDASDDKKRITNDYDKKKLGLKLFYRKYKGLMSNDDEKSFFERSEKLFRIYKKDITGEQSLATYCYPEIKTSNDNKRFDGHLIIGIIVTYEDGAKNLLDNITKKLDGYYTVVLLNNTGAELFWADGTPNVHIIPEITNNISIADAREKLQKHIYNCNWKDNCVVWLLDDDMLLYQLLDYNKQVPLDIRREIPAYMSSYDAVIGGYTNDAPLPLFSTLRLSLLDYCFSTNDSEPDENNRVRDITDYYYSLTDSGYDHIEQPINTSLSLDDIFRGHATRLLFHNRHEITSAKSRGGNTLIFNKDLLLLPTCSLKMGKLTARRGDYLWVLCAKAAKYDVCQGTFSTFHNRQKIIFDYDKEMRKLIMDLVGSSMTKAIEQVGTSSINDLTNRYHYEFEKRLSHVIEAYYRIIGLLDIIGDDRYKGLFSQQKLNNFTHTVSVYNRPSTVDAAFRSLIHNLGISHHLIKFPDYSKTLSEYLSCKESDLIWLGRGYEGCVCHYNGRVFKLFYEQHNWINQLESFAKDFIGCHQLYDITIDSLNGYTIISYEYEPALSLDKMHASEMVQLLLWGKEHGFCFRNLKPDNFLYTEGGLRYIDYGKDIVPFDQDTFQKSVERSYQVFRYSFLDDIEFKEVIYHSYNNSNKELMSGVETYKKMFEPTYKEQIHDGRVLDSIRQLNPYKILDYGAGKCKIANRLVQEGYEVDVYDIDNNILYERADKRIRIFDNPDDISADYYDVVNCNQVLCWTAQETAESIMKKFSYVLKTDGHLVLSICDPFFSDVAHTMLRGQGRTEGYYNNHQFQEYTSRMKAIDGMEHHRPMNWYIHLLRKYGFDVINSFETDGINTDTANTIGEHLVLICKKRCPYIKVNCPLLIKTCAMDHATIYDSIVHIITQLEYGCSFNKHIVCVDVPRQRNGQNEPRTRAYSSDDNSHLTEELLRAFNNGWIDRIIIADESQRASTYRKYFPEEALDSHATNGQPIFSTLFAFDHIKDSIIFQTDCDVLYYCSEPHAIFRAYRALAKTSQAYTLSLSICHRQGHKVQIGQRTEVRSCFLNLRRFKASAPYYNEIKNNAYLLPWHRCLDEKIQQESPEFSIRCCSNTTFFIHPENELKTDPDFMASVRYALEQGYYPDCQLENVNLAGRRTDWIRNTRSPIVIVTRGKNTSTEKVKRMLDSIASQSVQTFSMTLIYTDANSSNSSEEYAAFRLKYDKRFADAIYIPNKTDHLEIDMLINALQHVSSPDSIIITVDNDDFLIGSDAIDKIVAVFKQGADYVCGNCIRYDKPLRNYRVECFEKLWERNGDNIWLHPICFRKYLFDKVPREDFKADGEYINVCTDFAYAVPMVQMAEKPMWNPSIVYYFEPSLPNQKRQGKYSSMQVNNMRNRILKKANERYETDNSNYRR